MKLPKWLGKAKVETLAATATKVDESTMDDAKRKVNIVDIGRADDDGKDTLTGYCSLSENLEPCEWTFSKPKDIKEKPLLRILF